MSVCMSLLSATRLSIIRGYTLHQTGYRHSIHHVRSDDYKHAMSQHTIIHQNCYCGTAPLSQCRRGMSLMVRHYNGSSPKVGCQLLIICPTKETFTSRTKMRCLRPTNQASQANLHRQVHVHAGIPCKFNNYMHTCIITLKYCHIVA